MSDEGFHRKSFLQAAWENSSRDFIKNVSLDWGGQDLMAVQLSECIKKLLWMLMRPYLQILAALRRGVTYLYIS